MKYGLNTLLFHSFFERQKVEINKYNNRLQNYGNLNICMEIYLNYKILQTEIWNMSPEIFL